MRYIAKRTGRIDCLHDEQQMPPPETPEEATSRWGGYHKKDLLTGVLDREQYGLCAYTELRPDKVGLGTHIEHVKPKSKFPELTFCYANLVLCALESDDLEKSKHKGDVFGGHAKDNKYSKRCFLSPLISRSENSFLYQSDGRVVPSPSKTKCNQKKAKYTIDLLNLNAAYLVNLRKRWIEELDKLIDKHRKCEMSLSDLAAIDLLPINGKLSRFFTATRQRFGSVAERVLKENSFK